jgi:hypothetical protein
LGRAAAATLGEEEGGDGGGRGCCCCCCSCDFAAEAFAAAAARLLDGRERTRWSRFLEASVPARTRRRAVLLWRSALKSVFFGGEEEKVRRKVRRAGSIDGIVVVVSLLLLTLSALAESPAAPSGRRQSLPCPEPGVWSGRASAARTPRTRRAARYRSWFLEYEIFFSFFFSFLD